MKPLAPGTVIYHQYRGYGVVTSVNLMTGWISARFSQENKTLDLNLSCDQIHHSNGEPIYFNLNSPDKMPHGKLMKLLLEFHKVGYQKIYLYSWPKPSGLHWRWHIFTGTRNWINRSLREGWYGSGDIYNNNPILGWGDSPGSSINELQSLLAKFDPHGLASALGNDDEHALWFENVCNSLLPNYTYSLSWDFEKESKPVNLPIIPLKSNILPYSGKPLNWPPGWSDNFNNKFKYNNKYLISKTF